MLAGDVRAQKEPFAAAATLFESKVGLE